MSPTVIAVDGDAVLVEVGDDQAMVYDPDQGWCGPLSVQAFLAHGQWEETHDQTLLPAPPYRVYDPNEGRNEKGQWASGGGRGTSWAPSMDRAKATAWASQSALPQDFYHGTTAENHARIARDGFVTGSVEGTAHDYGVYGVGVYLTEERSVTGLYGPPLTVKINVQNPLWTEAADDPTSPMGHAYWTARAVAEAIDQTSAPAATQQAWREELGTTVSPTITNADLVDAVSDADMARYAALARAHGALGSSYVQRQVFLDHGYDAVYDRSKYRSAINQIVVFDPKAITVVTGAERVYDPSEARDEKGEWAASGEGAMSKGEVLHQLDLADALGTPSRFSPIVDENRRDGRWAVRQLVNGARPLASAHRDGMTVHILPGHNIIYQKDGWAPAGSGIWMDFPEDHWGLSKKEYQALPTEKRAALEATEQLRYAADQFYGRWLSAYHPDVADAPTDEPPTYDWAVINARARATAERLVAAGAKKVYDPDQARDEHGRWTSEGGANPSSQPPPEAPEHPESESAAQRADRARQWGQAIVEHEYREALAGEPAVSALMQSIAHQTGGALNGFEFRIKTPESTARKVADYVREFPGESRPQIAAHMKDIIRYTVEAPTDRYSAVAQKALDVLRANAEPIKVKNDWAGQRSDYYGVNTFWRAKDGTQFEVQFHTPESFSTKMSNHLLYERARNAQTPETEARRLVAIMGAAWAHVPHPPGAEAIKRFALALLRRLRGN